MNKEQKEAIAEALRLLGIAIDAHNKNAWIGHAIKELSNVIKND